MKQTLSDLMRMSRICRMIFATCLGSFILVIFYFQSMFQPVMRRNPFVVDGCCRKGSRNALQELYNPTQSEFSGAAILHQTRRDQVVDACRVNSASSRKRRVLTPGDLKHLVVDEDHELIYCYVPKVACTNWKRVMLVLSQALVSASSGKPYARPESIPPELVHNSSLYFTFAKFFSHYGALSRHMMALKLKHYTKFLFVRDPFVRLISAFRNKFERPNEFFYRHFGSVILRRYANLTGGVPDTAAEAFAAGIKPTFGQFVSYLLDPELDGADSSNEHWQQVYRLCHPCQVQYDFIGQLENLESDSEQLLDLLQVDQLIRFPSGARNRTSASWVSDWFKQVPVGMRRDLYRLYQPDFQLFGYPEPSRVLQQDT